MRKIGIYYKKLNYFAMFTFHAVHIFFRHYSTGRRASNYSSRSDERMLYLRMRA